MLRLFANYCPHPVARHLGPAQAGFQLKLFCLTKSNKALPIRLDNMNYPIHDKEDSIHFVSLFDHVLTRQIMLNLQLCG